MNDAYVSALTLDGLNESHPILQEVKNPDEISSLFDSISYDKVWSICQPFSDIPPHVTLVCAICRALASYAC